MKFELIPVFERMEAIYQLPFSERFKPYLYLLQEGNKDELKLPISGYNPMGKPAVLEKLQTLMAMEAEVLASEVLKDINQTLDGTPETTIRVVLNLADDQGGAWTNHYTTDFSAKFQISPMVNRRFCTPYFWTSEAYSEDMIRQRVSAAIHRTLYWLDQGAPSTLAEHLASEVFVQSKIAQATVPDESFSEMETFFNMHQDSEDYHLIFNFFYGDEASDLMGFATFGRSTKEGFAYAKHLAGQ